MILLATVDTATERTMVGANNKNSAVYLATIILFLYLLTVCALARGQESATQGSLRYIIDTVVVTIRKQANDSSEVLTRVKSGDQVRLTGGTKEPYEHVVLDDGTRGWVDKRYLSDRQVARVEVEALRTALEELQLRYDESLIAQTDSEQSLIRLSDDFRIVSEELETLRASAGNPTDTELKLEQLQDKTTVIKAEGEHLLRRNKELEESSDTRWFLIGAGVLLGGIVLGLALPKGGKKRSSWGRL